MQRNLDFQPIQSLQNHQHALANWNFRSKLKRKISINIHFNKQFFSLNIQ